MRRFRKLGAIVLASAIALTAMPANTHAEINLPETIKVGLYYYDSASRTDTDVASFTTAADKGLQIGFFKDGSFTEIIRYPGADLLTVRKDSYFANSSGKLTEYNPASGTIPTGEKVGPYHVKAGQDFPDQASALASCTLLQQSGVAAYTVYNDTWQVWTGFYTDEASAQKDITERLSTIQGTGPYSIVQPTADRIVVTNPAGQAIALFGASTAYFRVVPAPDNNPGVLSINGKKYRGCLEVRRLSTSDMTVINVVKLQEYLYGNVPPEIGANSDPEALKAQALASKMYALNNIGKHGKTGFDLCATTSCQVYKGFSAETAKSNAAIDEVKDKIITYNGKPAGQIFYFASSGGRTEDAANVWGYSYPYLKSVEDNYEPIYNWTKTMRAADIRQSITGVGNILGINITKKSEAGRATELVVRGESSQSTYRLERCRTVFGLESQLYTITTDADVYVAGSSSTAVKSQLGGKKVISANGVTTLNSAGNNVTVIGAGGVTKTFKLVPEAYTFTGKGWGHAVGLSQEGARGMAKAGFKCEDIIQHYFVGTVVQ